MTIDQIWTETRGFYESHYRVKFSQRPTDEKILYLFTAMKQLERSLYDAMARGECWEIPKKKNVGLKRIK